MAMASSSRRVCIGYLVLAKAARAGGDQTTPSRPPSTAVTACKSAGLGASRLRVLGPTCFANGAEGGEVRERAPGSTTHPLVHRGAWRRRAGRGSSAPPCLTTPAPATPATGHRPLPLPLQLQLHSCHCCHDCHDCHDCHCHCHCHCLPLTRLCLMPAHWALALAAGSTLGGFRSMSPKPSQKLLAAEKQPSHYFLPPQFEVPSTKRPQLCST
jgi:hypothetical protein